MTPEFPTAFFSRQSMVDWLKSEVDEILSTQDRLEQNEEIVDALGCIAVLFAQMTLAERKFAYRRWRNKQTARGRAALPLGQLMTHFDALHKRLMDRR